MDVVQCLVSVGTRIRIALVYGENPSCFAYLFQLALSRFKVSEHGLEASARRVHHCPPLRRGVLIRLHDSLECFSLIPYPLQRRLVTLTLRQRLRAPLLLRLPVPAGIAAKTAAGIAAKTAAAATTAKAVAPESTTVHGEWSRLLYRHRLLPLLYLYLGQLLLLLLLLRLRLRLLLRLLLLLKLLMACNIILRVVLRMLGL